MITQSPLYLLDPAPPTLDETTSAIPGSQLPIQSPTDAPTIASAVTQQQPTDVQPPTGAPTTANSVTQQQPTATMNVQTPNGVQPSPTLTTNQ